MPRRRVTDLKSLRFPQGLEKRLVREQRLEKYLRETRVILTYCRNIMKNGPATISPEGIHNMDESVRRIEEVRSLHRKYTQQD